MVQAASSPHFVSKHDPALRCMHINSNRRLQHDVLFWKEFCVCFHFRRRINRWLKRDIGILLIHYVITVTAPQCKPKLYIMPLIGSAHYQYIIIMTVMMMAHGNAEMCQLLVSGVFSSPTHRPKLDSWNQDFVKEHSFACQGSRVQGPAFSAKESMQVHSVRPRKATVS